MRCASNIRASSIFRRTTAHLRRGDAAHFLHQRYSVRSVLRQFTQGPSTITGYYAQAQSTFFDALTLTGGVRYDDDAEFGGHTSVKLAGAWQVLDGTTLHANYGDGFKAPSLYEMFSQYSNPVGPLAAGNRQAAGKRASISCSSTIACARRSPISSGAPPT